MLLQPQGARLEYGLPRVGDPGYQKAVPYRGKHFT